MFLPKTGRLLLLSMCFTINCIRPVHKCKLSWQQFLFEICGISTRALMVKIQGYTNNCTILTLILLMWRIGWAPNSIPIYIQQDATLDSLLISGNCSTCFGWYFHPSSGAHTTVFTASGICHTVTAICRYSSAAIAAGRSNGATNTRCCRYSCLRFW
jgi:hypothetical protein